MSTSVPYVIVVSDGHTIRTLHPPALGRHREAIERAIDAVIVGDMGDAPPSAPRPAVQVTTPRVSVQVRDPASSACLTQGEIASVSGYSGNACRDCGSFAMKRTGTCETCEACGSTSGGCS